MTTLIGYRCKCGDICSRVVLIARKLLNKILFFNLLDIFSLLNVITDEVYAWNGCMDRLRSGEFSGYIE